MATCSQQIEGRQGHTGSMAALRGGRFTYDFRHQSAAPAAACDVLASYCLRSLGTCLRSLRSSELPSGRFAPGAVRRCGFEPARSVYPTLVASRGVSAYGGNPSPEGRGGNGRGFGAVGAAVNIVASHRRGRLGRALSGGEACGWAPQGVACLRSGLRAPGRLTPRCSGPQVWPAASPVAAERDR